MASGSQCVNMWPSVRSTWEVTSSVGEQGAGVSAQRPPLQSVHPCVQGAALHPPKPKAAPAQPVAPNTNAHPVPIASKARSPPRCAVCDSAHGLATMHAPSCSASHLVVGDLERDVFVRLRREDEVLHALVRRLHALLVGRHEAVARLDALLDLGVLHLGTAVVVRVWSGAGGVGEQQEAGGSVARASCSVNGCGLTRQCFRTLRLREDGKVLQVLGLHALPMHRGVPLLCRHMLHGPRTS